LPVIRALDLKRDPEQRLEEQIERGFDGFTVMNTEIYERRSDRRFEHGVLLEQLEKD
jgi:hypothetical protein